jgi:hypothetical protein
MTRNTARAISNSAAAPPTAALAMIAVLFGSELLELLSPVFVALGAPSVTVTVCGVPLIVLVTTLALGVLVALVVLLALLLLFVALVLLVLLLLLAAAAAAAANCCWLNAIGVFDCEHDSLMIAYTLEISPGSLLAIHVALPDTKPLLPLLPQRQVFISATVSPEQAEAFAAL